MTALLRLVLLAALVGALEWACRTNRIAPTAVIAPSAMAAALLRLLASGDALPDLVATLARVAQAAALSIVGGLALGLALHARPRLRAVLEPLLAAWYAIPTIMFYPVLLVLFGAGSGAIVATAVLLAAVAMLASTLAGLDRVPAVLLRTALTLGMGPVQTAWRIRLPAAAPSLVTGAKLVVAYAFIGVIASEFIFSGSGLGYAVANAYNDFDNPRMYALMLLVVALVTGVNATLQAVDRKVRQARR